MINQIILGFEKAQVKHYMMKYSLCKYNVRVAKI